MKRFFVIGLHVGLVVIVIGAFLTFFTGESGELHLREGESAEEFELYDGASAGLPFGLRLDSFSIDNYPGSEMPRDYISEVTVLPGGEKRTISMNHILKWKGYRFYQADYDEDLSGSILAVSHDPLGVTTVYIGYFIVLVCLLAYYFQKGTYFRTVCSRVPGIPRRGKQALAAGGFLLLLLFFFLIARRLLFKPLMPVLRSPLLWVHVLSMIISYTVFGLLAVNGIVGLCWKRHSGLLRDFGLLVLYPAIFVFMFGIIVGSVWANISWGTYWGWDPKETWSLITLLVYSCAFYGHRFLRKGWAFHVFAIIAFLFVLVTYFGVNYFLGGLHSYA